MKPPPTTFAFIISVAIVTTLISFPIDVSFLLVLNFICSRRPALEKIGLSSFNWMGTEVVDPSEYEDSILLSAVEVSSFDPMKRVAMMEREENAISYVLRVIRRYFVFRETEVNNVIEEFIGSLGIYEENSKLKLTLFRKLFFATPRDCIAHFIRQSRMQAYDIISNLDKFGPGEQDLQESYLMQNFTVEQFSIIPKAALRRHFFQYARSVPKSIHPVLWMLGWIYVLGGLLYILYFVLLWGSLNDGISLSAWGTNFSLETLHACFVTSTLRLFLFNVLAIEILRSRLLGIYQSTISMAEDVCNDDGKTYFEREGSRLIQIFSPSCIAARWARAHDLMVGRVLRSLTDDDVATMKAKAADSLNPLRASKEDDNESFDIVFHDEGLKKNPLDP